MTQSQKDAAIASIKHILADEPPDTDPKKWPSQISAWSAEVHEKIEDAIFKN